MNKIYKVIWSKVRNCYVAVSEIAKRNGKDGFIHRGQVALTLAMALWIAGGGVASAYPKLYIDVDAGGKVTAIDSDPVTTPTPAVGNTATKKTLTVKDGDWTSWNIYGGYSTATNVTGYSLTLDGVKGSAFNAGGGYVDQASGKIAENNTLTLKNSHAGDVYGGCFYGVGNSTGDSNDNTVNLDHSMVDGSVYGGIVKKATSSTAVNGNINKNKVILDNSTVTGDVYGGGGYCEGKTAIKNKVWLKDSMVDKSVYGGYSDGNAASDAVTGNVLNLSGANTVGGKVQNFETINFENVTWGKPALSLTGNGMDTGIVKNENGSYATINTQNSSFSDAPATGTTTLIQSKNDLPALEVFTGATTKETITMAGVVVKATPTEREANGVTLAYRDTHTVALGADRKTITYNIANLVGTVTLGSVAWQKGTTLFDGSAAGYNYAAVTTFRKDGFDVSYASPENVAEGDSMTLLKANDTLQAIVNEERTKKYVYKPTGIEGDVTLEGKITGRLSNNKGRVIYTATANQATKLAFGDVNWKDSGALIDHKTTLANITFAGAAVDTSKINFINKRGLKANQQMTLVSGFGGRPGSITGTRYKVGTAFEGEGSAEMSGDDLIFKTKTGAGNVSDETHKTVMAMEAGMALLAAGSEHVGSVMNGLDLADNAGSDGTTVAASIGGGASRYETGSHVNTNTWNAAVAVGAKKELERGALEYGLFGEYGKGNYTLHSDAGRGDGDAHYAGGGLLAKWTNKHNVYAEASFRLGRMSDSASDILHDAAGNGYGYDVHANYYGGHVGIGQVTNYRNGRSLDVYGKYFYTKRDGVSFDAGADRYSLDSVASSVLRIGARYGTTVKKWNWYGGLAYEYEFDGKADGTVNGTAIRSASVKGSSVRGELGLRMDAAKDNPWKADIAIYGYGGKHRGFGGSVNVAYTF